MSKIVLDKKGICEYQQNRDPYLLIDFASEVIPGKSAKGYKDLKRDEWFFKVHWEGDPNMPGMLQIEALVQMAALSILQATLTLPGIAGIVLTMGMAVDANVLIFERIREELRSQKSVLVSVESGYKRAIGTIVDANLTTLIAAACLYGLGSGPIKGFAITLSIGIITSMFTAVMLTRMFVTIYLRKVKPAKLIL